MLGSASREPYKDEVQRLWAGSAPATPHANHHSTGGRQGQAQGNALPGLPLTSRSLGPYPSCLVPKGASGDRTLTDVPAAGLHVYQAGPSSFSLLRIDPSPGPYDPVKPTVWGFMAARTPCAPVREALLSLIKGVS